MFNQADARARRARATERALTLREHCTDGELHLGRVVR